MNRHQRRTFELYVELRWSERTLSKLADVLSLQGKPISMQILETWSNEFDWPRLARDADTEFAQRISEAMVPHHVIRTATDLDRIHNLKEGMYRALLQKLDSDIVRDMPPPAMLTEIERLTKLEHWIIDRNPFLSAAVQASFASVSASGERIRLELDEAKKRAGFGL